MLKTLTFIFSLFLLSCATGVSTLENLDISISDLTQAIKSVLPLGRRQQSNNDREFYSEFFVIKKGEYEDGTSAPVRSYAHIAILGDRRPYKIEVKIAVEKRTSQGTYRLVNYDEGQARVMSRRIQSALHKRREDRNIIDDFRIF